MSEFKKQKFNTVKRSSTRATYNVKTAYDIIDAGLVCQISFNHNNKIHCIPMTYGRIDNSIYIHGSNGSRLMKLLSSGEEICINITLTDGLIFTRSLFTHSLNYRSVCIYGTGEIIKDHDHKIKGLMAITQQSFPGRWDEVRPLHDNELNATSVVAINIDDAAAKVRNVGPIDIHEDLDQDTWAGEIPLKLVSLNTIPSDDLKSGVSLDSSASKLSNQDDFLAYKCKSKN